MTLSEFRDAFAALRNLGWVPSQRKGPTGVGYTLERQLGLVENNIALPDLGSVELKAHRVGSNSMITLFTFNRKAWLMPPLEAIRAYGTPDANGRLGLYFTMSLVPNSAGLFLLVEDDKISVRHVSGMKVVEWRIADLAQRFSKKMPALVLVSALVERRADREWFRYTRAQVLSGTSPNVIHDQIEQGNILVDLRLHDQGTRARNHGTGFRVHESRLDHLFVRVEDI